jgi:hypothetical protein
VDVCAKAGSEAERTIAVEQISSRVRRIAVGTSKIAVMVEMLRIV